MTGKQDQGRLPGPDSSRRILLGIITGAHGIRGDVIVKSFAAAPEDVAAYGPLSDEAGQRTFKLKVVRATSKGAVIARIAGISDRNTAEALKGISLYVDRSKLPATSEGEFYHTDLIGMVAFSPDGGRLGDVVAVHNFGAGDILELRIVGKSAGATELVPFDDTFVPAVDVAARRVTVMLPQAVEQDDDA